MKKGFISMSMIYTFLIVYLLMLTILIVGYYNSRILVSIQKEDLKSYLIEENTYYKVSGDINVEILIEETDEFGIGTNKYLINWTTPLYGYYYNDNLSYCTENVNFVKYTLSSETYYEVSTTNKASCYFYYNLENTGGSNDITITFMKSDNGKTYSDASNYSIYGMYNLGYQFDSYECTNNASISFDSEYSFYEVTTKDVTECIIYFISTY